MWFTGYIISLTQVEAHISTDLADISNWISAHHLKFSLNSAALLFFSPGKSCPLQGLSIIADNTTWTPGQTLGRVFVSLNTANGHTAPGVQPQWNPVGLLSIHLIIIFFDLIYSHFSDCTSVFNSLRIYAVSHQLLHQNIGGCLLLSFKSLYFLAFKNSFEKHFGM